MEEKQYLSETNGIVNLGKIKGFY